MIKNFDRVQAVKEGTAVITAQWGNASSCNTSVSTEYTVSVELPPPASLEFSPNKITKLAANLAEYGFPAEQEISLAAVFTHVVPNFKEESTTSERVTLTSSNP